jgi:hypothetical protein
MKGRSYLQRNGETSVRLDSDNYLGRSLTMVLAGGEKSEAA